jgi:scyllo-inositol 2-dehydrogenase (NADP+)
MLLPALPVVAEARTPPLATAGHDLGRGQACALPLQPPSSAPCATAEMAMRVVNVGLVGYGFAGKVFHAPLIGAVEGLRLTHVASSDAAKVQRDLPQAQVVANAQALLAAPEVDLVVVATPNQSHFALASGRCSRASSGGQAVRGAGSGREHNGSRRANFGSLSVFATGAGQHFLTLREILRSGLLGPVHSYEAHFDRFRPQVHAERWREQNQPGAGVLYDLGSHLIDQALCLFGRPQTVWAQTAAQRPGAKSVDSFRLVLGYRERTAVLRAASLVRNPGPRYQVHGTRGSFIKYGFDPQEDALRQGARPGASGWGEETAALFGELAFDAAHCASRKSSRCPAATRRATRCGGDRRGQGAAVSAREAIDVIRVVEAAMKSAALGTTIDLA